LIKFFICCLSFIISLPAQPEIPVLEKWATDFTSTLTSGQLDDLNYRLKTYEDTTSSQLVALMISTLNDYPIEYFAIETAEKNKIGTKEHDNGALFLVVKDDKKARIEVGYGLEGVLPDALASSIIRNVMIPHFKAGDYYTGISDGIQAAMSAIAGEYKAVPKDDSEEKKVPGFIPIIFILFFIFTFSASYLIFRTLLLYIVFNP